MGNTGVGMFSAVRDCDIQLELQVSGRARAADAQGTKAGERHKSKGGRSGKPHEHSLEAGRRQPATWGHKGADRVPTGFWLEGMGAASQEHAAIQHTDIRCRRCACPESPWPLQVSVRACGAEGWRWQGRFLLHKDVYNDATDGSPAAAWNVGKMPEDRGIRNCISEGSGDVT